jgi:tetratricopeptide (TPR) repeat protein
MADVNKLKKKAADFEQKKQFDKALQVYVELLDAYDSSDEEVDLALYNRVGDLFLKAGNTADAVDYYERAVDRYAEGGFFNNAIALCNKILRNSPGRASVYYKLGKISAHKGFKGDAKANFLEYADRMQKTGKFDEAFRALKEFADLCPDQDDIRLLLADQLSKKGRGEEAIEQLQLLYERYTHEGRNTEAQATVQRMKAIDPMAAPREPGEARRPAAGDLVFLDVNDTPEARRAKEAKKRATQGLDIIESGEDAPPPPPAPVARAAAPPPAPAPPKPAPRPTAPVVRPPEPEPEPEPVQELTLLEPEPFEMEELPASVLDGLSGVSDFDRLDEPGEAPGLLDGLETTSFEPVEEASSSGSMLDFDPSSFGAATPRTPPPPVDFGDDLIDLDLPVAPAPAPPPRPAVRPPAPPPRPAAPPPQAAAPAPAVKPVARPAPPPPRPAAPVPPAAPPVKPVARPAPPPPRPSAPVVAARPPIQDLPLIDDGASIGGDLDFIMPDDVAPAAAPHGALDDIPLMDLEDAPADLEMLDLAPSFEMVEPAAELSPAELDVTADYEPAVEPEPLPEVPLDLGPPAGRPSRHSTIVAAHSVELLQAMTEGDPDDLALRQQLGEALLESGDREGGLRELEAAMIGHERNDDLSSAADLADEIVRLNPASVRHHQKRVEYAFRTNERGRLIEAYLELANALFRAGQVEKSRAIYQRVLDLAPDDIRAQSALESFPAVEPEPAPPPPPAKGRSTVAVPRQSVAAEVPAQPSASVADDEFVNLGDWLRDEAAPKDTRMIVEEQEPSGDEQADFQDMLRKFKQGIAENVEEEDHQSHYDLGVAYKEMGLLDEAIAEFQKALRAPVNRVPTYEALGQCFIEKEQFPMAATILARALAEKGLTDDQLVGVLYLLGLCAEARGQTDAAIDYYQRVFVVDIQFRDVGERLASIEGARS